jgi:NADH-quinone oxidoreductase subunit L
MAGPTPVSALIHAATMVTAGIYMLARTHFLFSLSPFTMSVILIIAGLTSLIAALIALVQNDIKKVLAYSTVSQLGFMFLAAGTGAYWVALFHVVTHAFFKACLFLGAGSVIHGCHHEQDMRQMGGLAKKMPITFITYLISTIAIAGIFPFAGYFSKHSIMSALQDPQISGLYVNTGFLLMLATTTAILTAFYMTRSLVMTFFGEYRGHAHPHESPITMTLPLIVLAALGAVGGYYLNYHHRFQDYLGAVLPKGLSHAPETIVESVIHSWPGFLGIIVAVLFYTKLTVIPKKLTQILPDITNLLKSKCYFDEIYESILLRPIHIASNILFKNVDRNAIDFTVNGVGSFVEMNGEVLRQSQSGQIRNYMFWMFIATVFIIVFCFIW